MLGPIYLERCETITYYGQVRPFDPKMRVLIDVWHTHHKNNAIESLQELHNSDGSQHSPEIVDLFRRFAAPDGSANAALIYVHRGHQRHCKTPLLQSLLATLAPGARVCALRVEAPHLPLEIVLLALAELGTEDRCVIVKDNAIRIGSAEVTSKNTIRCIVLSRLRSPWIIHNITLHDEEPSFAENMTLLPLDDFVTKDSVANPSLALTSRTMTNQLGIIHLSRQVNTHAQSERHAHA